MSLDLRSAVDSRASPARRRHAGCERPLRHHAPTFAGARPESDSPIGSCRGRRRQQARAEVRRDGVQTCRIGGGGGGIRVRPGEHALPPPVGSAVNVRVVHIVPRSLEPFGQLRDLGPGVVGGGKGPRQDGECGVRGQRLHGGPGNRGPRHERPPHECWPGAC